MRIFPLVTLFLVTVVTAVPVDARADGFGAHPNVRPTSGFGHVDRSGMNEHVLRGLSEGLLVGSLFGYALTSSTDGSSYSRVTTGAILGGAVGVVLPLVLNRNGKEVRSGDVVFINEAQNWGLIHGYLVPLTLQLSEDSFGDVDVTTDNLRVDAALAGGLSLLAGGLAAYGSSDLNFTPGQAAAIGSSGYWGAFAGLLGMLIVMPDSAGVGWARATIAVSLGLADVTMGATWANRDSFDIERSRVLLVNLAGIAGALVGIAGAYFIDPRLDSSRVVSASILVGGGVGVVSGFLLTDNWDEYKKSAPPIAGAGTSLVEYRGGKWGVGAPMPTIGFLHATQKPHPFFSLLNGRY